jgi:ABC-type glycerol-3-phosphate transport system substrate-binding protein
MREKMTRVRRTGAGALILAAATLAATGGGAISQASGRPADAPVTITFWNEMTGPYQAAINGEIAAFRKLHPNITIQDVVVSNDAALKPKLLAAVVAGDPPTISQMNPPWATGFIQSHALVDLNPYIKGRNGIKDLSDFYPSMLAGGTWPGGQQYLMPFNLSTAIMYYNKNQFTQAGIKSPPATWAQWNTDLEKLSGHGREAYAITLVHSYSYLAFFYEAGGKWATKNGLPNPAAFAPNGPAVKALALWTNEVKHGWAVLTQGYASQTDFANETSSVLIGTSAFGPYLKQAVGNKFTIAEAPLPADVEQGTALFGGYLGIFSKASPAQRLAAFEFLKYLTSTPGQVYWVTHTAGYLPVRKSAAAKLAGYFKSHPAQAMSLKVLPYAHAEGKEFWWSQFSDDYLINAIEAALLNQMSPAAASHKAYEEVEALIKQNTYGY